MFPYKKFGSRHGFVFASIILIIILLGFNSCNFQNIKEKPISVDKENYFSYDLNNPDKVYHLPGYLNEISGISCYKKSKIACIQDEKAIIYFYDTKKGDVISKLDFGSDDDFEDIAIVGDNAYALRSDGTIFKIKNFEDKQKKSTKIKTPLDEKNNAEGLLYDKETNSLLIVCKDSQSIHGKEMHEGNIAIYRFDLEKKKFIEKPEYLIDITNIDNIRSEGTIEKLFVEAAKKLKLTGETNFHPSGIAINPLEPERIFLISGVEKLLIVINRSGKILEIKEMNSSLFTQPEGICFSKNGDLYISNEGRKGNGNILKFKMSNRNSKQ